MMVLYSNNFDKDLKTFEHKSRSVNQNKKYVYVTLTVFFFIKLLI